MILSEMANLSLGQKNLKFCQMKVLENFSSSPNAFPILVNIKPYHKYTKNTENEVFNFFPPKFGVLPILQECPYRFSEIFTRPNTSVTVLAPNHHYMISAVGFTMEVDTV